MLPRAVSLLLSFVVLCLLAAACQPIDPATFGGTVPPLTATPPTDTPAPFSLDPNLPLEEQVTEAIDNAYNHNYDERYYGALPILDSLLALDLPDDLRARALVERGKAHILRNDWAASTADLIEALQLGGSLQDREQNRLCWGLGLLGRAEEALPYCETALANFESTYYRDSRGLALAQVGRYEEAVDDFQSYIEDLDPPR